MKKTQWIVLGLVALLTIGLYILTQDQVFGAHARTGNTGSTVHAAGDGHNHEEESISIDTLLAHAHEQLKPAQRTSLSLLENSITRGAVSDQKAHLYHRLAAFWRDSARLFEPFAWYTGEAARLENSEKSLTFAAHLYLNSLREEENPALKQWKALQAKDLFDRSLQLNPDSDSSKVGLGATLLFGGLGSPMDAVGKIRNVASRDSNNVYAQRTLGEAALLSQQTDRAIERFTRVARLQPRDLLNLLLLAQLHEQAGRKAEAASWYRKSLPLIGKQDQRKMVEERISLLEK
jgi:tetratricopeptide (TPR) repeat protein